MAEIKEVQIRRRETHGHLNAAITGNSKKYLSSVYSGQGPLRALDPKEETTLLSQHLGVNEEDRDFHKVVRSFWADLRVEVPLEGKTINITKDENGRPVHPYDYIIFKFAKAHPLVGDNERDMLSDTKKQFYIFDFEEAIDRQNETVKFKKKAYAELIKIGDDEEKLDRLLRLLSDTDPAYLNLKAKQNELDKILENDSKRFYLIATDKDLEIKSIISEMVAKNIITKYGNQHYFIEEKLGDTLEETVLFFKDKKRSEDVTRMKAKLQEAKRV